MARPKGNTGEKILKEALLLFSIHGYEAVSIRDIADAVGIKNSSLYNHFRSKREIFNGIIDTAKQKMLEQKKKITDEIRGVEALKQICHDMFLFQTTDEWIVLFRQMIMLEQYRNKEAASLYKELFIDLPLNNTAMIFESLQKQKIMKEGDPQVYAMEFYSPFFLYHVAAEKPDNLQDLYDEHIEYFFQEHF